MIWGADCGYRIAIPTGCDELDILFGLYEMIRNTLARWLYKLL